jgi:predicted phage terminase large subunit-like protein
VKLLRTDDGRIVVCDVQRWRKNAAETRRRVLAAAVADGHDVRVSVPEDPGQAGKEQAASYVTALTGYSVSTRRPQSSKLHRAEPFAAQWQAGNVSVLRGPWNDEFFAELEAFPETVHDDQVDACADAFAILPDMGELVLTPVGDMEAANADW